MKRLCLTDRIGDGCKLLQAMTSREIMPNTVIYNTLLHAFCRNGKNGRARSLMNEMKEPNDETFIVLIYAYSKEENLVQALALLEKCFSLGYVPDVVSVTKVLDSLQKKKKKKKKKVLELLCNVGRVTEAVEILERLESKGGVVDIVAYNTLIKGFCRLGKMKVRYSFLMEMERKGYLPNIDTYNILISGFCEYRMLDLALDLFKEMKTNGINWIFVTYDTLIKALCLGGRMEDGFKILELMEESKAGSGSRISPYNSLLYGLYKEN